MAIHEQPLLMSKPADQRLRCVNQHCSFHATLSHMKVLPSKFKAVFDMLLSLLLLQISNKFEKWKSSLPGPDQFLKKLYLKIWRMEENHLPFCCPFYFFLVFVILTVSNLGETLRNRLEKKCKLVNGIWAGKYKWGWVYNTIIYSNVIPFST